MLWERVRVSFPSVGGSRSNGIPSPAPASKAGINRSSAVEATSIAVTNNLLLHLCDAILTL